MLFFENDYGYGAHPKVLEYLAQTNMEPVSGYGNDKFTASAAEKIKVCLLYTSSPTADMVIRWCVQSHSIRWRVFINMQIPVSYTHLDVYKRQV